MEFYSSENKSENRQEIYWKMDNPGNITLKEVIQSQINTFIFSHIQILFLIVICMVVSVCKFEECPKTRKGPMRWRKIGFNGKKWLEQQNTCGVKEEGVTRAEENSGEMGRVCVGQNKYERVIKKCIALCDS